MNAEEGEVPSRLDMIPDRCAKILSVCAVFLVLSCGSSATGLELRSGELEAGRPGPDTEIAVPVEPGEAPVFGAGESPARKPRW